MPGDSAVSSGGVISALTSCLICLTVMGCQSDIGGGSTASVGADRAEYIGQFKKMMQPARATSRSIRRAPIMPACSASSIRTATTCSIRMNCKCCCRSWARNSDELLSKLDRNWDGKVTATEFQVVVNWLFQPSRGGNELTLADVQAGTRIVQEASSSPSSSSSKDSSGVPTRQGVPGKR